MRRVSIAIEELSTESFSPFGYLIGASAEPEALTLGKRFARGHRFSTAGETLLKSLRMVRREMRFHQAEAHFPLTQGYVPMEGDAAVIVVAPRTAENSPGTPPPPEAYRAFLMDGQISAIMAPGVWHAMASPLPVSNRGARYLMLTDADTDAELRAFDGGTLKSGEMKLTAIHDYRDDDVEWIEIIDPLGLLRGN